MSEPTEKESLAGAKDHNEAWCCRLGIYYNRGLSGHERNWVQSALEGNFSAKVAQDFGAGVRYWAANPGIVQCGDDIFLGDLDGYLASCRAL